MKPIKKIHRCSKIVQNFTQVTDLSEMLIIVTSVNTKPVALITGMPSKHTWETN